MINPVFLQIILVAIPILLPPLVGLVIVWINSQLAKLPANQRAFLSTIVSDAVLAVEQAEKSSGMGGVDKKALAMQFIEAELQHWGINVPASIVSTLVESVVKLINTPPATPVVAQAALGPAMHDVEAK